MMDGSSELDKRITAAGYDPGIARTEHNARGLKAAAVVLEHIDPAEMSGSMIAISQALEKAGLGSLPEVLPQAQAVVNNAAAMEQGIADRLHADRAQILGSVPPESPGPPPAGLGHPETSLGNGTLGFLFR